MQETTKTKVPITVMVASILNYAGAFSSVVILWSLFNHPVGLFFIFNFNLHRLFIGPVGLFLFLVYLGGGYILGVTGGLILYFILILFSSIFFIFLANELLKGKKWSYALQVVLSSIFIFLTVFSLEFSLTGLDLSITLLTLTTASYISANFLFNKKVKEFYSDIGKYHVVQVNKRFIILIAIAYLVVLTSLLLFFNNKYNSQAELNKESVSRASPNQKMVMPKGMEIIAETQHGTIKIIADDTFTRTYVWGNCSRTETLEPQLESLGATSPPINPKWELCEGINGSLSEERQMHFTTAEEAVSWINKQYDHEIGSAVYRNDGLYVSLRKTMSPGGRTGILEVNVRQILINGAKPMVLSGSDDSKIKVKTQ
jgi:hypothetical protein